MLIPDGAARLRQFSEDAFSHRIYQINHRISYYTGWGHCNVTVIEGNTSLILVDTPDSDSRGRRLREHLEQRTGKPVRTILFTHGHPDHRGGSGAFRDTAEEVIAFAPYRPPMEHYERLSGILGKRGSRQFGYQLTEEECLWQGLGPREGHACGDGQYNFLPPTTVCHEPVVERCIDGVKLCLAAAPGESDDGMFVWFPEDKVLCCGDNYYGCWPNLYAIRGSQYRDVAVWVNSLKAMLRYPAQVLLPGHTLPVFGSAEVRAALETYCGAIESILLRTLACMEQGMSESETVEAVCPEVEQKEFPCLGEFYGTIQWSVRSIYQGYFGWFDGNPTNLNKLPDAVYASELMKLIGKEALLSRIRLAAEQGNDQLVLQLADLLLQAKVCVPQAMDCKYAALLRIAQQETSANGRHYYIACAKELSALLRDGSMERTCEDEKA